MAPSSGNFEKGLKVEARSAVRWAMSPTTTTTSETATIIATHPDRRVAEVAYLNARRRWTDQTTPAELVHERAAVTMAAALRFA